MAEPYAIKISNKLVDRLIGEENKRKKKTKKSKPKNVEPPQQPPSKRQPAPLEEKNNSVGGWPLQPPFFVPISPSPPPVTASQELEAIRSVLHESESVLERLQKQEANMLQELNLRAKELREKEFKLPYQNPLPCTSEREACLQCYKGNAKDSLKCAEVVKNFADCARRARQEASLAINPVNGSSLS